MVLEAIKSWVGNLVRAKNKPVEKAEPEIQEAQAVRVEPAQLEPIQTQVVQAEPVPEQSAESLNLVEPETPIFTVSGNADCPNAIIFVTFAVSADENGRFAFRVPNGTYALRPASLVPGKSFSPEVASVRVNEADAEVNFVDPSSVVDSRNYGNFPNHHRTVQGTQIYDVPSVDSRTGGAPVDSRTGGAPQDCRVVPNVPQNSRA
jgi:hypothetical protein